MDFELAAFEIRQRCDQLFKSPCRPERLREPMQRREGPIAPIKILTVNARSLGPWESVVHDRRWSTAICARERFAHGSRRRRGVAAKPQHISLASLEELYRSSCARLRQQVL